MWVWPALIRFAVASYLDDRLAVLMYEVGHLDRDFLIGIVDWIVPPAFVVLAAQWIPDHDAKRMCRSHSINVLSAILRGVITTVAQGEGILVGLIDDLAAGPQSA
jgi:ABC-type uncharacterized transport system YnjBCD permease subunit